MFELHSQLQADTVIVGHLPLSLVLLSKDANYPWCILVPQRANIREIHQLDREDQIQLWDESCALARTMEELFNPIKMNVAALGNMVPQLHLHHIARFEDDRAWPGPVWGKVPAKSYADRELSETVSRLQQVMQSQGLTC